jgi:hypothetical protein
MRQKAGAGTVRRLPVAPVFGEPIPPGRNADREKDQQQKDGRRFEQGNAGHDVVIAPDIVRFESTASGERNLRARAYRFTTVCMIWIVGASLSEPYQAGQRAFRTRLEANSSRHRICGDFINRK